MTAVRPLICEYAVEGHECAAPVEYRPPWPSTGTSHPYCWWHWLEAIRGEVIMLEYAGADDLARRTRDLVAEIPGLSDRETP